MPLRLSRGADVQFADEASLALRHEGRYRVRDVIRLEHFRRVFPALPGEFRRHRARANGAHADAVTAQILSHAAGKAHEAPF
jgi:hypothetical protein